MSESQTEMRAIKQNLRLYQPHSHQGSSYQSHSHSQPQNLATRSIHPFSEWLSEQASADLPQPDRASAKAALISPPRQSHIEQPPQVKPPQIKPPQARQPVDLPQINLPLVPATSPSVSSLLSPSPPSQRSTADRPEADVDWEPVRPVAQTHVTADRLQQKSVQYLQQFVQPTPDRSNVQIDADLKRLEAQAQHINQLAITQEAAILELKAIAQQIERDWKTLEVVNAARAGYDASNIEIPAVCEYSQISVPLVEKNRVGVLMLTDRSIDLFKAEREAAITAQSLRFRTAPPFKPRSSWTRKLRDLLLGKSKSAPSSETRPAPQGIASPEDSRSTQARGQKRKIRSLSFQEGMSLLFGAVLVRVILNLLLSAHPAFRFSAIALMVVPGAIAVYRSRVTPKLTLTWGSRLIVIMIGFLIGGLL
ncbi:MAG: hypothetical protein KME15_02940 [Drouetiella hepatica Uher 2000/2452]|uniref:Uncharacterized protein n=1 Tax=Drouetiella hepatica Uher 2000/2452 TaxID=904376 RepID=A0A951UKV0_9CYAN|nr:hypothetical protein [Drouetiella hepatica Uher 2000/2452]